jgi:YD repeat-containing protein
LYTYNNANELVRMTEDGVPTAFTYDAWGRTSLKTKNGYASTYVYRSGDKLQQVNSTFPGEKALVQYIHDGLGKRRLRTVDGADKTFWRWNGWEEHAEYGAGSGGFWDMGDVAQRTYLPGLGEAYPAGTTPMADHAYYTPDHLGSVRGIRGPDRNLSGNYAYEPYGQTRAASGLPPVVAWFPDLATLTGIKLTHKLLTRKDLIRVHSCSFVVQIFPASYCVSRRPAVPCVLCVLCGCSFLS